MRVFVQELEFVGFHGVYEDERREGRSYSVDIWAEIPSAARDDISATLDYCRLSEIVLEFAASEERAGHILLETLSTDILNAVLARFEEVSRTGITIRKRAKGVAGDPKYVGVELALERESDV